MTVVKAKKHGVMVTEHRGWNTKKIYNDGFLLMTYRRQPKVIRFKSPMVNDMNQNHCGGWTIPECHATTITDQLVAGLKPLGIDYFGDKDEAIATSQRLLDSGLISKVGDWGKGFMVRSCRDIRVCDIGDLDDLAEDYLQAGLLIDVDQYRERRLVEFLDEFDSPPHPLWLTGLILGYPIENTISLWVMAWLDSFD